MANMDPIKYSYFFVSRFNTQRQYNRSIIAPNVTVRMAEWSKAPDSRLYLAPLSGAECSGPRMWAWVQIPLLTRIFLSYS